MDGSGMGCRDLRFRPLKPYAHSETLANLMQSGRMHSALQNSTEVATHASD